MSKLHRRTRPILAVATAVAATAVAACGSPEPAPTSGPTYTPPPSAASHPDGITGPADAFGPACAQLPQGVAPGSLYTMARFPLATAVAPAPQLTELSTAIKSAGLVDTLNAQQGITVFAPYDSAFDEAHKELGEQRYTALVQDKEALADLLKYHVIAKRYDKAGLLNGQEPVATLAGGTLKVLLEGDAVTITDGAGQTAHVLCGNIPTANATVFLIDKLLQPQKP